MSVVTLSQGSGGEETSKLIKEIFLKEFSNPVLEALEDSAILKLEGELAFTTDGFTVSPIFFKGGDLGKLAVSGTVNDLAVMGAKPMFMSASFIVEEGFPLDSLKKIVKSMAKTAGEVGVSIVTGDTKVVPRGNADGVFISCSGIGKVLYPGLSARNLRPGDVILVSGTVGDHGACILAEREGMEFDMELESDCAPLWDMIEPLLREVSSLRAMRDATRGGLAELLNEWSRSSMVEIEVDEESIPVKEPVRGLCELLGFEPTHLANEGMITVAVAQEEADKTLDILKSNPKGRYASVIGRVVSDGGSRVIVNTLYGVKRIMEPPSGELLPRIC